jgi:hypothetical protein
MTGKETMVHRHRFEARTIRTDLFRHDWETKVLYVCSVCGKPKVDELPGRWTAEDLNLTLPTDYNGDAE